VRVVLQRVSRASVSIGGRVSGAIEGPGLLLLVGFTHGDSVAELEWMADKVTGLRIFPDEGGRMNRSLGEAGAGLLVVSQFTLYGDARKGRRPSFTTAARPDEAIPLYERFIALLRARVSGPVATGEFGAMMEVALVNDGPVTLVLERAPGGEGVAADQQAASETGPPASPTPSAVDDHLPGAPATGVPSMEPEDPE
jgi:D-aminoacyl-tRNA deacylase